MTTFQVHQLTAPRTIQAFLVVLFSIVSCVLVMQGQEIPDLIGWTLAGIVGYYFNAKDGEFPFPVVAASSGGGSTKRTRQGITLADAEREGQATENLEREGQSDSGTIFARAMKLGKQVSLANNEGSPTRRERLGKSQRLRPV